KGRITAGPQRHGYTFRRLFTCAKCGNTLTGEGHKGHVYYRCHTRGCNQASVREEAIDAAIEAAFIPLQFSNRERLYLQGKLRTLKTNWQTTTERELRSLELRHNEVRERLSRLTDAVIDKLINKCEYEERKAELLMEQQDIAERKEAMTASTGSLGETVTKFFELAESLYLGYKMGIPAEKRDLIKMATSNRTVNGKDVVVKPCFPFDLIAKRSGVLKGAPSRARLRTLDEMLAKVVGHFESNPESASRLRGHGDFRDVEGQDCAA
ncbi:MAG TPA: zinc ribbon domain-containing protein, partial [Oligoflexia bacterium]|nr:zinc ribbon domain-containing protein [Oligoflexia bacterium]